MPASPETSTSRPSPRARVGGVFAERPELQLPLEQAHVVQCHAGGRRALDLSLDEPGVDVVQEPADGDRLGDQWVRPHLATSS